MTDLTSLINIGIEMQKKLESVDIFTAEQLKEVGAKEAFFRLKTRWPNVCLVHLYTLEGAIENIPYNVLSPATKAELKAFSDSLK